MNFLSQDNLSNQPIAMQREVMKRHGLKYEHREQMSQKTKELISNEIDRHENLQTIMDGEEEACCLQASGKS
jgi:hypothetical protein